MKETPDKLALGQGQGGCQARFEVNFDFEVESKLIEVLRPMLIHNRLRSGVISSR